MTVPHYNCDVEQKVIGCIITREANRDQVFAAITGDVFYDRTNRRTFQWLLERYLLGALSVDERTVFSDLMRDDVLSKVETTRFFYDAFDVRPLIASLVALRDARTLQAAATRALQTLSVNPEASAELIADVRRSIDEIDTSAAHGERLWTWTELNPDDHPSDWVIPDVMDRDWVVMVTGPNGGGKSTLCLQMAVGAAIGVHPWTTLPITPQRVLYIDAENSPGVVARKKRIAQRMVDLGDDYDVARIRFRFGTVNLAQAADRLRLEHHMQTFEPDLVVLGPIYKMYSSGSDDSWRAEAIAVQTWVDRVRRRYGFGTLIEGHPPKGDGTGAPKGDSSWGSWPYYGFCVTLDDERRSYATLTPWRYPREPVRMPEEVMWGQNSHEPMKRLMWSPAGPLRSSEDW